MVFKEVCMYIFNRNLDKPIYLYYTINNTLTLLASKNIFKFYPTRKESSVLLVKKNK